MTVNGAIEVTRSGGFAPSPGDQFEIVQANPRFGFFSTTLSCDVVALDCSPTAVTLAFAPISTVVGELTGDGVVDGADLGILLNNWG